MEAPSQSRIRSPQFSRIRSPLSISTNSPPPAVPPTLSSAEQPALLRQRIRRKASLSYHKKDSSEETPGSNGSIYNAHSYSNSNSADSGIKTENSSQAPVVSASQGDVDNEPNWENWECRLLSLDDAIGVTPIIYGQGTRLDTIIEKNSNSTMQSLSHSKSTGALSAAPSSSFSVLGRRTSSVSQIPRQRSLSMDDLTIIQRSYHEACASLVGVKPKRPPLQIDDIYAKPKEPPLEPPKRTLTPPGLPSWTAMQRRPVPPRRSSDTRSRILSWWNGQPTIPSRIPLRTSDGARISLPRRMNTLPRYRPPRSAYGSLDTHPFNRLPIARPVDLTKRHSSGINVTRTWTVESSPAPQEQLSPISERPRTVHFSPSVIGNSETTASTLSDIHNLDRINAVRSSNYDGSGLSASTQQPSCNHRRHSSFTIRPIIIENHRNSFTPSTTTSITSGCQRIPVPKSPVIPRPVTADGYSVVVTNISASPATSQIYLVPVTNLESEKKRNASDACLRCHIRSCFSGIGKWIDRTGERMERIVDSAGKKICLICCGYVGDDEDEEEGFVRVETRESGMRGGGGGVRESLAPRRVLLSTMASRVV